MNCWTPFSIVQKISTCLPRRAVTFSSNLRKKGARKRSWWHPKLLRNKFYKGYGSGTMMTRGEDGRWEMDTEKIREFVVPSMEEVVKSELKAYVSPDTPVINVKPVTEWDYLKRMEETWTPEAQLRFSTLKFAQKPDKKLNKFGS